MRHTVVSGPDLERVRANAEKCWLNGKSHVRSGTERQRNGLEDQLVGQIGEYGLAKFFGVVGQYFERRDVINRNPWKGDGGSDLIGRAIDIKSSFMRASGDPSRYNLLVRPAERHKDNTYVLGLVTKTGDDSYKLYLVGYAYDSDLPNDPCAEGVFSGAFRIPAAKLRNIDELKEAQ